MTDERGPAHCPACGVVEPAGGFDRNDPAGTNTVARFRCLDCRATFPWRCFPGDSECTHGPFQLDCDRFVFYFGQGTRREATRSPAPETGNKEVTDEDTRVVYRADLNIASYDALQEFVAATSEALVDETAAEKIQAKLEAAGGDVTWPCEVVFEFDPDEWATHAEMYPDEATVLEPHLVSVPV